MPVWQKCRFTSNLGPCTALLGVKGHSPLSAHRAVLSRNPVNRADLAQHAGMPSCLR